jgi:hypothetical protein
MSSALVIEQPTPMSAATRRMIERELMEVQLRQRMRIAEARALLTEPDGQLGRWVRDIERAHISRSNQ